MGNIENCNKSSEEYIRKLVSGLTLIYSGILTFGSLVKNCNHKRLGIYYLLSAFIFGISGTLISVLMRMELYSSGNRIISPENQNFYNVSITLHGLLMIFFLVMPALFGGFGNYFAPIFQGSPEVVYPRVNNFQPNFWNSTKNNLWDPINDLCHELYFSSWNSSLGTSYVYCRFRRRYKSLFYRSYNLDIFTDWYKNL